MTWLVLAKDWATCIGFGLVALAAAFFCGAVTDKTDDKRMNAAVWCVLAALVFGALAILVRP